MRILGIDPGYATIGYGIIDYFRGRFSVVGFGAITTKAGLPFEIRLRDIYDDMNTVIEKYKPDDTADALALAVCHANYSGTDYSRLYKEAGR